MTDDRAAGAVAERIAELELALVGLLSYADQLEMLVPYEPGSEHPTIHAARAALANKEQTVIPKLKERIAELERALLAGDDDDWGKTISEDDDSLYCLLVDELSLRERGAVVYGHHGNTAEQLAAARRALGGEQKEGK